MCWAVLLTYHEIAKNFVATNHDHYCCEGRVDAPAFLSEVISAFISCSATHNTVNGLFRTLHTLVGLSTVRCEVGGYLSSLCILSFVTLDKSSLFASHLTVNFLKCLNYGATTGFSSGAH